MLRVLLLAVLGWSPSEGRNVSVCELTTQLRGAAANSTKLNASDPNVLAQIVCHADILSNLSTSAQTNETHVFSEEKQAGGPHGENHDEGPHGENHDDGPGGQNHDDGPGGQNHDEGPHGENHGHEAGLRHHSRSVKGPDHEQNHPGSGSPPSPPQQNHPGSGSPPSPPQQNCTLYGIFQLSSCQACNDGVTPIDSICKLNCSELLDDDISNDVVCLFKVMFTVPKCTNMWQELEESLGKNQKNQSGQCSNVSAYMCS